MHTARFLSLRTKIFVTGDENLLCAGNKHQRFLSLTTIFNIKHARISFSSLTTEDKIFVVSDKNHAVCARLKFPRFGVFVGQKLILPWLGSSYCMPKIFCMHFKT